MSERELLEALYRDMQGMKEDMQGMKDDMQGMKDDMQGMKDDMQSMKDDMQGMKDDMQIMKNDMRIMKDDMQSMKGDLQEVKDRTSKLELTLENETNHNIQLLAENHINLVDKLNEAISVQNKSILYEVQVSGLKMRVDKLEQEVKEIKSQIA